LQKLDKPSGQCSSGRPGCWQRCTALLTAGGGGDTGSGHEHGRAS